MLGLILLLVANSAISGLTLTALTCNENEEVSTCANAVCYENCTDVGKVLACPAVDEASCTTGCVCIQDYLRASNGTCVPQNQCDTTPTCNENEEVSTCANAVCYENCTDVGKVLACPAVDEASCTTGCVCIQDYLRASNGTCVPQNQCDMTSTCNENEEVSTCANAVCYENCTDVGKELACPAVDEASCTTGCVCIQDYLRASNGTCVPQNQCDMIAAVPIISIPEQPSSNSQTFTGLQPSAPSGLSGSADTCDTDAQENALENGNTAFTGKFFYQVVKNNPEVSVIMSPFSVLTPLGILGLYTDGKSNQELLSTLNLKTKDDIRCAFPGVLDSIKASNGTELDSGAKLYVYKQGQLSESLQNDAKTVFNAEVESLDFNNPQNASDVINQWVSEETKGKITQLTSPDMFNSMTRLVIVNAIYFKGSWKYKFDANNTTPRDFYVNSNKTIQVPTMQQKGKFRYAELSDPDIQVVELPYEDESITFLAILPGNGTDLLSVVEKMQDPEMLNNIYSNLYKQTVTIYLPKIPQVTTKSNLVNILESIGIEAIFDPSSAELSGLTDPNESLYVSDAIQEATFTVDETGSEASAANAFGVTTLAAPVGPLMEYVFDANRPYVIYININQNITLFCSAYYG